MPQIPITTRTAEERPLVKVVDFPIPNPAAGAAFDIIVPVGYRFKIASICLEFNTDANVADRFIIITITTPAGRIFRYSHIQPIIDGETRYLSLAPGISPVLWTLTNMTSVAPLPSDITLEEGAQIVVTVTNIQVGDQFANCCAQLLSQFVAE